MAQAKVTGSIQVPGWHAPIISDEVPGPVWDAAAKLFEPYRHLELDMRNGIAYFPEEVSDRLRDKFWKAKQQGKIAYEAEVCPPPAAMMEQVTTPEEVDEQSTAPDPVVMVFRAVRGGEIERTRIPIADKHALWEMQFTPKWMNKVLTDGEKARYTHVRYETFPSTAVTPDGDSSGMMKFSRSIWDPGRLTIFLKHVHRDNSGKQERTCARVGVCKDDMFAVGRKMVKLPDTLKTGTWGTVTLFKRIKDPDSVDEEEDVGRPENVLPETEPQGVGQLAGEDVEGPWDLDEVFSSIAPSGATDEETPPSPDWHSSFNTALQAYPWATACREAAEVLAKRPCTFVECSQCEKKDESRKAGLSTVLTTPGAEQKVFDVCCCTGCGEATFLAEGVKRCTKIVQDGTNMCPECLKSREENAQKFNGRWYEGACICGCNDSLFCAAMETLYNRGYDGSVYATCLQCGDNSVQCTGHNIPLRCDECMVLTDSSEDEDYDQAMARRRLEWKAKSGLEVRYGDSEYYKGRRVKVEPLKGEPITSLIESYSPKCPPGSTWVARSKKTVKAAHAASIRSKARELQAKVRGSVRRLLDPCDSEYLHGGEHGFHFPQVSICGGCRSAAQQVRDHRRKGVYLEIGGLSVDLIERIRISDAIEYEMLLASATTQHRKVVVCVPLISKEAEQIFKVLMMGILIAEYIWGMTPVSRIHSDREPGLLASEAKLHENAIMLTVTEGHNSNANPIAESYVNVISRMARIALHQAVSMIEDKNTVMACREYLWPYAIEFSAAFYSASQTDEGFAIPLPAPKVSADSMAPFLCTVLATRTTKDKRAKDANVPVRGYYLGPDMQVPVGNKILGDDGKVFTCTTVSPLLTDGKCTFPKKIVILQKQDGERGDDWDETIWVQCEKRPCGKWRPLSKEEAWNFDDDNPNKIPFDCKVLAGTTCRTPMDKRAFDDDATRRASGRDKTPGKNTPRPAPKKVAKLAQVFGCEPDVFSLEAQETESFQALVDWVSEDACVADEGQEQRNNTPLEFEVEWTRTTAADEQASTGKAAGSSTRGVLRLEETQREFLDSCAADVSDWNRIRAHVVKVFSMKEAKQRPKYAETVAKQVGSLMGHHTWGPPDPLSTLPGTALMYRGKLIYGCKHWEDPEMHKDKARVVVQGCLRITKDGRILLEKWFKKAGEFWAPTSSMAGARFITALSTIYARIMETTDLDSGYCQTSKRNTNTWLILDDEICEMLPDDWQVMIREARKIDIAMGGKGKIAFPLWKNLFGECPAGQNFIEDFQGFLIVDCLWHRAPHDHGMLLKWCLKKNEPMAMATYVDDLFSSLTQPARSTEFAKLHTRWIFEAPYCARKFLGIKVLYPLVAELVLGKAQLEADASSETRTKLKEVRNRKFETNDDFEAATAEVVMTLSAGDERLRCAYLSQGEYMRQVIEKYENVTGRKIRKLLHLPIKDPPECEEKREAGTVVRSAAGGLMYGARGTQLPLMKATHIITTRVTTWSDECTAFLEAVLGHAKALLDVVLVFDARGQPKDWYQWQLDGSGDADHKAPKCYSGSLLCMSPIGSVQSDNNFLPLDFASVGQRYAKLSPAESEVVCAVHLMRYGLRYADTNRAMHDMSIYPEDSSKWTTSWRENQATTMHDPVPECVTMIQREDNAACKLALERGWSQKLAHISTVYQVSILWAAARIKEGRVTMVQEPTAEMMADPLTKLTDPTVLFRRGILKHAPEMFIKALLKDDSKSGGKL